MTATKVPKNRVVEQVREGSESEILYSNRKKDTVGSQESI